MKAAEYRKLKKEVEERYEKAIQKAQNERVEALAAIEKVWKMMKPSYGKVTFGAVSSSSQYGSLAETVRKSLKYVPSRFTKKDVIVAMQQISSEVANRCNTNSLSGCLHRLKKEGIIAETKKGIGSMPTEYELVGQRTEIKEEPNKIQKMSDAEQNNFRKEE